jgi:hypothetical protein
MNQKHKTSQRNLAILAWFGLACQVLGYVGLPLYLIAQAGWPIPAPGNPLGPTVAILFGISLGGWAGNLRQINELKQRLAALEAGSAAGAA